MSYFRIVDDACSLPHFVWADNKAHALRKAEMLYGCIVRKNGAETTSAVSRDQIPEGTFVLDEPELEREAREDEESSR